MERKVLIKTTKLNLICLLTLLKFINPLVPTVIYIRMFGQNFNFSLGRDPQKIFL